MNNNEIKSNLNVIKLAEKFKKTGCYPNCLSKLGKFLSNKRQAYKDFLSGIKTNLFVWYETDLIIAKECGLPDDWLLTYNPEKESNKKVIELADFYKTKGYYPNRRSKLGQFLHRKRQGYKDFICNTKKYSFVWYLSDAKLAQINGLPDDWMLTKNLKLKSKAI